MQSVVSFVLILLVCAQQPLFHNGVQGLAPPHPDGGDELAEYHRRLLTRRKESMESELCHGQSDQECLEMHRQMREQGRQLRNIADVHGLVRTLVLLIRFKGHDDREMIPRDDLRFLFTGFGEDRELAPSGTVRSFLETNAHGKYQQEFDVMEWIDTDETEDHYSKGVSGLHGDVSRMIHPVLTELENRGIGWSRYDLNEDGIIDNIIVVHSGHPAENGGTDCHGAYYTDRIWSHRRYDGKWSSFGNRFKSGIVSFAPSRRGRCQPLITRMGIIVHEFLHMFHLPDLVDPTWQGKGVGQWDCMGISQGIDLTGTYPSHLSAWSKMHLGWVIPHQITEDGLYKIRAAANTTDTYIIRSPYPEKEYLLIENRQPILWDRQLWNGGLLIWHVDETRNSQRTRGYPGQDGWPISGAHYELALVQADGRYDLEKNQNNGDDGDFYREGREFGPAPVESEATNFSWYPNSNSYRYGIIQQTGIRIYDISPSQYEMTFRISGLSETTTSPTPQPTMGSTPAPTTPRTPAPITPRPTTQTPSVSKEPTPRPTLQPTNAAPSARPSFPGSQPPTVSTQPTPMGSSGPSMSLPTLPPSKSAPSLQPSLPDTVAPTESANDTVAPTPGPTVSATVSREELFGNGTWIAAPLFPIIHINVTEISSDAAGGSSRVSCSWFTPTVFAGVMTTVWMWM